MALIISIAIAYLGWSAPSHTRPFGYHLMVSRSVPFAIAWALVLAFSCFRFKKRGLWLLLGAPMALYWPIWLVFNHFPPCYYSGNCK